MRFFPTKQSRYGIVVVDPIPHRMQALIAKLHGAVIFDVNVVESAGEAMSAIGLRAPTLVISELDLPDVGGVEFVTALRNSPTTRDILVLVVTTRNGIQDKIAAFHAGADEYLVQPVNPDYFLLRVQLLTRLSRRLY